MAKELQSLNLKMEQAVGILASMAKNIADITLALSQSKNLHAVTDR